MCMIPYEIHETYTWDRMTAWHTSLRHPLQDVLRRVLAIEVRSISHHPLTKAFHVQRIVGGLTWNVNQLWDEGWWILPSSRTLLSRSMLTSSWVFSKSSSGLCTYCWSTGKWSAMRIARESRERRPALPNCCLCEAWWTLSLLKRKKITVRN